MKKALFITFDIIREGEPEQSLAMGSILAMLKANEKLANKVSLDHISVNMLPLGNTVCKSNFAGFVAGKKLYELDYILLSVSVWNEYFINDFIHFLKASGFSGKIVLGGHQITYVGRTELLLQYKEADLFVMGYAEQSLVKLFLEEPTTQFLNEQIDFEYVPSPYLSKTIAIDTNTKMIRWETKRGCPFKCSFCAHRDLTNKKVHYFEFEKALREIEYFNETNVTRINILDPVFNIGKHYLGIMDKIVQTNTAVKYTLQTRFESIKNEEGEKFLDLCAAGNFHLEFGIQTFDDTESRNIDRNNKIPDMHKVLNEINNRNISYEVSLIYGLPGQTLDSFQRSIETCQKLGCNDIKAYPLMLLQGTKLYQAKADWCMQEEVIGDYNIPVVTSSNTFTRKDWESMQSIANQLQPSNRL